MLDAGPDRKLPAILLIDDDLVSREVMATVLTMSGFTVRTAEDGTASIDVLANMEFVPGLILMDTQMPGLSGRRLIEELRVRSTAPIVAISASYPAEELTAACDGFLLKPFAAGELRAWLDSSMDPRPGPLPVLSTASGSERVVDPETFAGLRRLMPDAAVRQIYTALVTDLTERQVALGAAIAKGDTAEMRRIGHAIKGGCGMAGAVEAARLGAEIESGVLEDEGNQLDNGARILGDLGIAAANLKRMLNAEFQT